MQTCFSISRLMGTECTKTWGTISMQSEVRLLCALQMLQNCTFVVLCRSHVVQSAFFFFYRHAWSLETPQPVSVWFLRNWLGRRGRFRSHCRGEYDHQSSYHCSKVHTHTHTSPGDQKAHFFSLYIINAIFFDAPFNKGEDLLWNDYEVKLLDQAVRTMETYVSQFPDVRVSQDT